MHGMTAVTVDQIYAALKTVIDPELGVNVVALGLIYTVELRPENQIYVKMTLTSPGCPLAGVFDPMLRSALHGLVTDPESDIVIELTFDPPWTPDMMEESVRLELGL